MSDSKTYNVQDYAHPQDEGRGQPFRGVACLFDPDVEVDQDNGEEHFCLYVNEKVGPEEVARMQDRCKHRSGKRRGEVDSVRFNEMLVDAFVYGHTGATAKNLRQCRVYLFNDQGQAALEEELKTDGNEKGIPSSKEQSRIFMASSTRYAGRINELASEVEQLETARDMYEKKVSRSSSGTGTKEET
jgi:hypothetical protein